MSVEVEVVMSTRVPMTRRDFLFLSALGLADLVAREMPFGRRQPLRAAVIGAGARGRWQAAGCLETQGVELAAVCDRSRGALARVRREVLDTGVRLTREPTDVLDDPSIDFVVVAAGHEASVDIARKACLARKDVLLDTGTIDAQGATELAHAAAVSDRLVELRSARRFSVPAADLSGEMGCLREPFERATIRHVSRSPISGRSDTVVMDELVEEIDYARALLEVGCPSRVTPLLSGREAVPGAEDRVILEFPGSIAKQIVLRLAAWSGHERSLRASASRGEPADVHAEITFAARGALARVISSRRPSEVSLRQFVLAVARRDRSLLALPPCSLADSAYTTQLADRAVSRRRPISSSPRTEKART